MVVIDLTNHPKITPMKLSEAPQCERKARRIQTDQTGSYFIVQTSKFLLINVTAVTLGQGHGTPDPYFLSLKYLT